ncbi:MAG: hypothetical protein KAW45_03010 [Thermoplasmatales archaeon]|nr:hypothetical protein [Thermoplasmatales archaeon]
MISILNLPGSTILEEVENIYGENQYEIENSEYSGLIARNSQVNGEASSPSSPINSTTGNLAQPGRVVLLSSKPFESSYASFELKNGVFSYYLVQGFGGPADVNQDGWVSAEEAFYYAEQKTIEYLSQYGLSQHPQIYDSYEGELKITQINQCASSSQGIQTPTNYGIQSSQQSQSQSSSQQSSSSQQQSSSPNNI